MAEPSWVGLGGLVASTLSALAAYLAIRQTIIQRRISNKVQIITKNIKINIGKRKIHGFVEFTNKSNDFVNQTDDFKIQLPLLNVGLGPALKFEYAWRFDYEKNLAINNIAKTNTHLRFDSKEYLNEVNSKVYSYTYDDSDGDIYINILGNGNSSWFNQQEKYTEIDYILPWGINKEEVSLQVPKLITMLLAQHCLVSPKTSNDMFRPIKGPVLTLKYEDITGLKKQEIFTSAFRVERTRLENDNFEAEFSLSFFHTPSWTSVVSQKIRKKYANWKKSIL